MTVSFKAPLQSSVTNTAYISKIADDIKTGKFTLANGAEGTTINSVQKYLNEISANQGYTEGDLNSRVYSSNNYISDDDSQKLCIEKLDNQVGLNDTSISGHISDATDAHQASAIGYDDSVSGNGQTTAQGAIDDNESRVQAVEDGRGSANGYASLDGSGKVPTSELPDSVLGALIYQGTWDANTNSPSLSSGVGTEGHYYIVSVAGSTNLDGITDWEIGDWVVYNGAAWEKIDNSDKVSSVNGQTGVVVLDKTDIGLTNVTDDAQLKRSGNDWGFTNKALPVELDRVLIEDSEDSFNKKTVLLSNLLGGGGGGGSFVFELNGDNSPLENIYNGISTLDFYQADDNEVFALLTVPESYSDGDQILLKGLKYFSSASSGNVFFKTETQLLKTSQDMALLPLTGHSSVNSEQTLTTANALTATGDLDLCDGSGLISGQSVTAGDTLLVKLYRDNTNETSSATEDARLLKFSASVKFDA
jgi:hypothetical protein